MQEGKTIHKEEGKKIEERVHPGSSGEARRGMEDGKQAPLGRRFRWPVLARKQTSRRQTEPKNPASRELVPALRRQAKGLRHKE